MSPLKFEITRVDCINVRLFDESDGNYTCTANDGASVVDYNIASSDLFPRVSYFNLENRDESVHFPCDVNLNFDLILPIYNPT